MRYGVEYKIGLDPEIVQGWSTRIAERIGHAALIYDRPLPDRGLQTKMETSRFYPILSPVCAQLRECSDKCKKSCELQDETIVLALFEKLDAMNDNVDELSRVEKFTVDNASWGEPIEIRIKYNPIGRISHCEYTCPTTHMTELAFPICCEDYVIALIITGQVKVESWCENECEKKDKKQKPSLFGKKSGIIGQKRVRLLKRYARAFINWRSNTKIKLMVSGDAS